jgi:beta-phosphoglucomutase-like phosphatase (HAD superfamily)
VFEDSPAGVTAASRAGMYTIAVCTSYTPPGLVHGAHFAVNSLAEVSHALRGRTIARASRQS